MSGNASFGYNDASNLGGIHQGLELLGGSTKSIIQKIESSLQTSLAEVVERSDDCTSFKIKFNNEATTHPAILVFDRSLYVLIGMPKFGDKVVVVHNNGNNAMILFVATDKDKTNPPNLGKVSTFNNTISMSKCMG